MLMPPRSWFVIRMRLPCRIWLPAGLTMLSEASAPSSTRRLMTGQPSTFWSTPCSCERNLAGRFLRKIGGAFMPIDLRCDEAGVQLCRISETQNYRDRISWSEAVTDPLQRIPQNIQVADVVGEQQDQLGVHHLALLQGKSPVRVNKSFVKVVRLGDGRFDVERHVQ